MIAFALTNQSDKQVHFQLNCSTSTVFRLTVTFWSMFGMLSYKTFENLNFIPYNCNYDTVIISVKQQLTYFVNIAKTYVDYQMCIGGSDNAVDGKLWPYLLSQIITLNHKYSALNCWCVFGLFSIRKLYYLERCKYEQIFGQKLCTLHYSCNLTIIQCLHKMNFQKRLKKN